MPFKTRKPRDQRTIQGAATILPTGDKAKLRKALRPPLEWQTEGWEFYDTVPELKFGCQWAANLVAKAIYYVATADADGNPIAVDSDGSGIDPGVAATLVGLLAELAGDFGGQADIQRELTLNLDIPGEGYLVGWAPDQPGQALSDPPQYTWRWEVRSISEVVKGQGAGVEVKSRRADTRGRPLREGVDELIRCWVRHPRWSDEADSNVMALTTDLRTLQVLAQQIMAESMSRASAKMLVIPNSLSSGPQGGADSARRDPAPEGADSEQDDPFVADLTKHITNPIQDPGDPSSVVPLIARVPDEVLKLDPSKWLIDIARPQDDALDKRIEGRVNRVARGLNMPVEVIMGHRDTTFANADQVSQDEFTDHLEPRILLQCDLLTVGYLRPIALKRNLVAPDVLAKVFVWYDADELHDPPDMSAAADAAAGMFAISDAAYRRAKGFTEDDAPTPAQQMAQLALRKTFLTAELAGSLLKQYVDSTFTPPPPPPPGMGAPGAQAQQAVQAGLMAMLAGMARQDRMLAAALTAAGYDLTPAPVAAIAAHGRDEPDHPR